MWLRWWVLTWKLSGQVLKLVRTLQLWANFLWKGFELNKTGCLPWEWIPVSSCQIGLPIITICYWQQQSVCHTQGAMDYNKMWRPLRHGGLQAVVPLPPSKSFSPTGPRTVCCSGKRSRRRRCVAAVCLKPERPLGLWCLKAAGQLSCNQK